MIDLHSRLAELLVEKLGVPAEDVQPDSTFEAMDLDSLILVEYALVLTKEFGVPLTDADLEPTFTIRDTAELLRAKGVAA